VLATRGACNVENKQHVGSCLLLYERLSDLYMVVKETAMTTVERYLEDNPVRPAETLKQMESRREVSEKRTD